MVLIQKIPIIAFEVGTYGTHLARCLCDWTNQLGTSRNPVTSTGMVQGKKDEGQVGACSLSWSDYHLSYILANTWYSGNKLFASELLKGYTYNQSSGRTYTSNLAVL